MNLRKAFNYTIIPLLQLHVLNYLIKLSDVNMDIIIINITVNGIYDC